MLMGAWVLLLVPVVRTYLLYVLQLDGLEVSGQAMSLPIVPGTLMVPSKNHRAGTLVRYLSGRSRIGPLQLLHTGSLALVSCVVGSVDRETM